MKSELVIVEMLNIFDYEITNYKVSPTKSIQIINLFETKYEELIEILKKKLHLKNWYQSQVND